jgi:hypothetical protein
MDMRSENNKRAGILLRDVVGKKRENRKWKVENRKVDSSPLSNSERGSEGQLLDVRLGMTNI